MKLPAGTDGGTITNPQEEGLIKDLMDFRGAIEIDTASGHGFIITENGKLVAAYFRNSEGAFRGKAALSHMITGSDRERRDLPSRLPSGNIPKQNLPSRSKCRRDENILIAEPVQAPGGRPAEPASVPGL